MMLTSPFPDHDRRLPALALTVALHLALLYGWHLSNQVSVDDGHVAGPRVQWLLAPPPDQVAVPRPRVPSAAVATRPRLPVAPPAPQQKAVQVGPPGFSLEDEPAPAAAPSVSMLDRAKGAVGGIDRDLQEKNKGKLIRAKPVSTQMRLERALQQAHDMAPNRWYEAPKVTEIIDPGGYGRRRYRVVGASGTYCISIESNHAPDGIDTMQRGIKPKLTNCPPDEQAATRQDW